MPRMRHIVTGAVVSVTDEKAARLGAEWVEATPPRKPGRKTEATEKSE